jgi:DNA-directed RNA polymerase I subunit RPA1
VCRCASCGLNNFECPGHFGHIEVSVPLYNPLVFMTLYKILRSTCLHCYKFRMSETEIVRFCERFSLLKEGNLVEALNLVIGSSAASKKSGKDLMAGSDSEDSDKDLEEFIQTSSTKESHQKSGTESPTSVLTSQMMETMIMTVRDFFKGQPTGKCQNCGAHSPTLKREGHTKLFLMPLSSKKRAVNEAQGTQIVDLLSQMNTPALQPVQNNSTMEVDSDNDEEKEEKDLKMDMCKSDTKDDEEPAVMRSEQIKQQGTPGVDMPKYLTPTEAKEIMRRAWKANIEVLKYIYPTDINRRRAKKGDKLKSQDSQITLSLDGYKEFFIQTIPVAPNRFRPVNHVGDMVYEHPQNTILVKILNGNLDLLALSKEEDGDLSNKSTRLTQTLRLWLNLQNALNALIDSSTADDTYGVNGIRQQLEKKEGLFRKNMMGKRVNFAARSVISPDVFLNGGEIGVPPYFASRLSFPERVTPWNVERLREAIIAGPGKIPGAIAVEDERGRVVMLRKDKKSREAIAKTLYASSHIGSGSVSNPAAAQYGGGKVVYRTMTDGDFMLTNRQPTLHKPGMMGHRARIMRAERTIRFHYANCSTFNADFDGDEINLHLPQDHLGRAEGLDIVHADQQFFVPTDGKPLRGLIQDHIVAGTLMTMRDRFLTQAEYCQLIYEAIAQDCNGAWDIWMEPPAIVKPCKLWTGKQVFTAVLMHYTRDQLPLTMAAKCKTPNDAWGKHSGDERMHIWRNHLVTGVVDKSMFGKNGLLHIFHVRIYFYTVVESSMCMY